MSTDLKDSPSVSSEMSNLADLFAIKKTVLPSQPQINLTALQNTQSISLTKSTSTQEDNDSDEDDSDREPEDQDNDSDSDLDDNDSTDTTNDQSNKKTSNAVALKKMLSDPEVLSRTLFLGNLPITCLQRSHKKELSDLLRKYGRLKSYRFRSLIASKSLSKKQTYLSGKFVPEQKTLTVYAEYAEPGHVDAAVTGLNGYTFLEHRLRADHAAANFDARKNTSVFVANLPWDASEEQVFETFSKCGAIGYVRLLRDRETGRGTGTGYVCFVEASSVSLALAMNGSNLLGRILRIQKYQPHSKGSKGSRGSKRGDTKADKKGSKPFKGKISKNSSASSSPSGITKKQRHRDNKERQVKQIQRKLHSKKPSSS